MTAQPYPPPTAGEECPAEATTAERLAADIGATLERATRAVAVAVEMVNDYAPDAPESLRTEAVWRFAGYLLDAGWGTIRKNASGPFDIEQVTNHAPAFRNCGAAMLLTRHKVRRGGVIG